MKLNNDPKNLCIAYDLNPNEWEGFYRGAGMATIIVDDNMNILACYYHERGELPQDDETPLSYTKKIFPLASKQIDGMMSCGQFCLTHSIE